MGATPALSAPSTRRPSSVTRVKQGARRVKFCDRVSHEKNNFGGLLTLAVVLLFATNVVSMLRIWLDTPLFVSSEQHWTRMIGPVMPGPIFPVGFKCLSPGGCTYASKFTSSSGRSQQCAEAVQTDSHEWSGRAIGCHALAFGANTTIGTCHLDLPGDGLYIAHNGTTRMGVAVLSVSVGPMHVVQPVYAGRIVLKPVLTHNTTREASANDWNASGRDRTEYYQTYLGELLPDAADGAPACLAQQLIGGAVVTQLSLDSSWTEVTVSGRSYLTLWGEIGGLWALYIEMGAIVAILYMGALYGLAYVRARRHTSAADGRSERRSYGEMSASQRAGGEGLRARAGTAAPECLHVRT